MSRAEEQHNDSVGCVGKYDSGFTYRLSYKGNMTQAAFRPLVLSSFYFTSPEVVAELIPKIHVSLVFAELQVGPAQSEYA